MGPLDRLSRKTCSLNMLLPIEKQSVSVSKKPPHEVLMGVWTQVWVWAKLSGVELTGFGVV